MQSAETVSFSRMSDLQRQAARAMLEDPAVDNIASIVGVDGANNTMLNAGTCWSTSSAARAARRKRS